MNDNVDKLDRAGEKVGAYVRAHHAGIPVCVALLVGWAAGANLPRWSFFVVCAAVIVIALWVIWAEQHKAKDDV